MHFSINMEAPEGSGVREGPVTVGWLLTDPKGGIIFDPPERVRSVEMNKAHAKSASRCPAVINLESRYFVIKSPFDLSLQFVRDNNGKPALRNLFGDRSPVRKKKLDQLIYITPEPEWRYADRPTIQVQLPYLFLCDEPVYMSQVAPFMHYSRDPLPGTIFGGRFPIHVWPRPLMWAFEWHDIGKPLNVKRGEPLFYAQFETMPQDRAVTVVEARRTDELNEYLDLISGAVNYVNQTFSLFREAEKRRPAKLVTPVDRGG